MKWYVLQLILLGFWALAGCLSLPLYAEASHDPNERARAALDASQTLSIQEQVDAARQQVRYEGNPAEITAASVLDRFTITAKEYPSFWRAAAVKANVLCQDGGNPILLPDGSALMTYGDTFLGQWQSDGKPDCTGGISSSIARVTCGVDGVDVQYLCDPNGQVDFLLPLVRSESWQRHRVWPLAGVHIQGTSYLFYNRILLGGSGAMSDDGIGLAQAQGTSWTFRRTLMPQGDPSIPIAPHSILCDKQGAIYLFYLAGKDQFHSSAYVARVHGSDKLCDPCSYEYFSGPERGFVPDRLAQYPIVNDVFGQYTVAWNAYLDGYVMLHVGGVFDNPRTLYLRTAQSPWGPWSRSTSVYSQPGEVREGLKGLFYCPFLQPQLFRENGRIMLLTYCEVEDFSNPFCVEITILPR